MKTINERKADPISAAAWERVTTGTIETLKDGDVSMLQAVYNMLVGWLRTTLKQPIGFNGTPLTPSFKWRSAAYFNDRPMEDVAAEFESAALEAAARAVDSYDEACGPLLAWVKRIMAQKLNRELEVWAAHAAYPRGTTVSLDVLLESMERQGDEGGEANILSGTRIQPGDMRFLMGQPTYEIESDPETDAELVEQLRQALTEDEMQVLELYADNVSWREIQSITGIPFSTARRMVERAKEKARKALVDAN